MMTGVKHEELVAALKEALTDNSPTGWVLLARVPIICNDVKWIKKAIFGIFACMGALLVAFLTK